MKTMIFGLLFLCALPLSAQKSPAEREKDYCTKYNYTSFFALAEVNKRVDPERPDPVLLNAALFHLTNYERKKKKLKELVYSAKLSAIANEHGNDMYDYKYFDHVNPKIRNAPTVRERMLGVDPDLMSWGENIVENTSMAIEGGKMYFVEEVDGKFVYLFENDKVIPAETYASLAKKLMRQWMQSQGHRANILSKGYTHLGCGCRFEDDAFQTDSPPNVYGVQSFGAY